MDKIQIDIEICDLAGISSLFKKSKECRCASIERIIESSFDQTKTIKWIISGVYY